MVPELFCRLLWLPCNADVELVRMRPGTGGRLSGGIELLLKYVDRSSRFSRSKAACCNFNSLIADISSNFCVSSEERDNISYNSIAIHNFKSQNNNNNI